MAELMDADVLSVEELEAEQGSLEDLALTRWSRFLEENGPAMERLKEEAQQMQAMASPRGSHMPPEIQKIFEELSLPCLSLNDIDPIIANLAGREVVARAAPKIVARDDDSGPFADACHTCITSIREDGDFEMEIAAAYREAHKAGFSAVEYPVRMGRVTPEFTAEKVPIAELLLDLTDNSPNYRKGTGIARGRFLSLSRLKREYPEFAKFWASIKEDDTYQFSGPGNAWLWGSFGVGAIDDGFSWRNSTLSSKFYRKQTNECFFVRFFYSDSKPMRAVRMPGETVHLFDSELPYDDYASGAIPDELLTSILAEGYLGAFGPEGPTVPAALGWAAHQAEVVVQQQELAAQQAAAQAEQTGDPPPPPYAPLKKIFRQFTPKEFLEFKRGYLLASGKSFVDVFEVDEDEWWEAIIVGRKVLRVRKMRHGMPSILALVCFADEGPDGQTPVGTARKLRDRQMWKNAVANSYAYALATMTKVQLTGDPDMFTPEEREELEDNLTSAAPILWVKPEALTEAPGRRDIPRGIEQAFERFDSIVPGGIGQTQATLGQLSTVSRTAYRLVSQQREDAQTAVSEPVDHLRVHRKMETLLLLRYIFTYWGPEDFAEAATADYADAIPKDRSDWWRALRFRMVYDEEPKTRHASLATLEVLGNSVLGSVVPPEALMEISQPAIGSKAYGRWREKVEAEEPQKALQIVAAANGITPEDLMAMIQRAQQPEGAPG
jgi:hypothetical protein